MEINQSGTVKINTSSNYSILNLISQTLEKVGFRVYYFHLPIVRKSGRTTIKLHNCLRPRILGKCIYTLAPLGPYKR